MVKLKDSTAFDIARYILSLGRVQKDFKNISLCLMAPNARVPLGFWKSQALIKVL